MSGGRPLKKIDPQQVERLASILCTLDEMALVLDCSVGLLERRFRKVIEKGRADGKRSLRRLQWEAAEKGDRTMLIWLGKQWLAQTDRQEVTNVTLETIEAELAKLERQHEYERARRS